MRPGGTNADLGRSLRAVLTLGSVAERTDAELLARFRSGGLGRDDAAEAAFAALVGRHAAGVVGVARRILGEEAAALDAAQATFLVLARRAGSIRVGSSLAPWLAATARRIALGARRAEARRRRHEAAAARPERSDEGPHGPATREAAAIVLDELARLPEPFRQALTACHLDGLTQHDAARALGWPVGTLQSRLARGRARLRDRLARRGIASLGLPTLLPARVPDAWVVATGRAALGVASGIGPASAPLSILAPGVVALLPAATTTTKGLLMAKATLGTVLLGATLAAVGTNWSLTQRPGASDVPTVAVPAPVDPNAPRADEADSPPARPAVAASPDPKPDAVALPSPPTSIPSNSNPSRHYDRLTHPRMPIRPRPATTLPIDLPSPALDVDKLTFFGGRIGEEHRVHTEQGDFRIIRVAPPTPAEAMVEPETMPDTPPVASAPPVPMPDQAPPPPPRRPIFMPDPEPQSAPPPPVASIERPGPGESTPPGPQATLSPPVEPTPTRFVLPDGPPATSPEGIPFPADGPDLPSLLFFWADWSDPCTLVRQRLAPLQNAGYPVRLVNVERSPDLKARYKIEAIPAFVLIDGSGGELGRRMGVLSTRDLADFFNQSRPRTPATVPSAAAPGSAEPVLKRPDVISRPWETVARIRVISPSKKPLGVFSGVVVQSDRDGTKILTTEHAIRSGPADNKELIIRDGRFLGEISVDLFHGELLDGNRVDVATVNHVGTLAESDPTNDLLMLTIKPGVVLPAARLAPTGWKAARGTELVAVGCSQGNDPTAWSTTVLDGSVVMKAGPAEGSRKIMSAHEPRQGRWGGGLFTSEGYLVGICQLADPNEHAGFYASTDAIRTFLQERCGVAARRDALPIPRPAAVAEVDASDASRFERRASSEATRTAEVVRDTQAIVDPSKEVSSVTRRVDPGTPDHLRRRLPVEPSDDPGDIPVSQPARSATDRRLDELERKLDRLLEKLDNTPVVVPGPGYLPAPGTVVPPPSPNEASPELTPIPAPTVTRTSD